MKIATIVMFCFAAALVAVAYFKGGQHTAGLKVGGKMMVQVLPLLLASFAVAGLVQVLVPKEFIAKWLGEASGIKGIFIGCFAGAITPGGPFVSFPIVASLYQSGAGIGTVVGFVTAWSLWAVTRLPMEVGLIGPRVTLIRVASTLLFPPLAGLIARAFFSKAA